MSLIDMLRFRGESHVGLIRSSNEDCYAVVELNQLKGSLNKKGYIFAVADGIGGHACGDIASKMACSELSSISNSGISSRNDNCKVSLEDAFFIIDSSLKRHVADHPECEDMGTTLSCLIIEGDSASIAHVGDSRIYRLRGGSLEQLTTDHTFVQEMIDMGEEKPEAAKYHPLRSVLTRAIGTRERLTTVDTRYLSVALNDRFLLCSDGLHDMVTQDEICSIMNTFEDPQLSAIELINAAMMNGGRDNVTVVTIFF